MHQCLLCHTTDDLLDYSRNSKGGIFWKCLRCGLIFLSPEFHLSELEQSTRYQFHQNDVLDSSYQNFLRPVIDAVLKQQKPEEQGMDFGCGPASVINYFLRNQGYDVVDYDPLFFPEKEKLNKQYDYITCTEVIEHFNQPRIAFDLLAKILKVKSHLYIKTSLTDSIIDFGSWYYHRDPTHVSFYNQKSLEFIQENWGFQSLQIYKEYFIFGR
jgi:hypothetical protein